MTTLRILTLLWLICFLLFGFYAEAHPQDYSNEEIADAIFLSEGGHKAHYLYGIRSITYIDEQDARRICLNTIRNNRKRYKDYGHKQYDTYLEFLQSRYCPVGCNNDRGTNKFWLRNVLYFLRKKSD